MISPENVYTDLMYNQDLPAPFIMLLSGGLIVFLIWFLFFIRMILDLYKKRTINSKSHAKPNYFNISIIIIITGFLTQFSHFDESHIPILIIVYISTMIWSHFNEPNEKI